MESVSIEQLESRASAESPVNKLVDGCELANSQRKMLNNMSFSKK